MRIANALIFGGLAVFGFVGIESVPARQRESTARFPNATERAAIEAIDTGAKLFNAGEDAACYRVYQGALIGFGPLLEANPVLQRKVLVHQTESVALKTPTDKAFALRKALDEILVFARISLPPGTDPSRPVEKKRATVPSKPEIPSEESKAMPVEPGAVAAADKKKAEPAVTAAPKAGGLWTRLGGEEAVRPAVHEWLKRAVADPKLDFTRGGKHPLDDVARATLEQLLFDYVSEAAEGQAKYNGRTLRDAHKGMKITDTELNLFLAYLSDALREQGLARKDIADLVTVLSLKRGEVVEVKVVESAPPPPDGGPEMKREPASTSSAKPLWDRLGGETEVAAIVKDLFDRALANPSVDFTRGGTFKLDAAARSKLERKFVEFFSSRIGGPLKYEGKAMKAAHKGMAIAAEQFDALGGDLILVLKRRKVSETVIDEVLDAFNQTFDDVVEKK